MSLARVEELSLFPLKGARAEHPAALHIDPIVGVRGDRRRAIKRAPDQPDAWAPKMHFRVAVNTPQMAAQTPVFSGDRVDPGWLARLAATLGEKELALVDTGGAYNMTDANPAVLGANVSFLNLASVRALAEAMGRTIDPARFRMNIWYDDGEPFSELGWANEFPGTREFRVGTLRFRALKPCVRCLAPEANPATGLRDLPVLEALESELRRRGYRGSPGRGSFQVMGFLATPLGAATIARADEMRRF